MADPIEKTQNNDSKMLMKFPILPSLAQAPIFSQQFFKPNTKLFEIPPIQILRNFHKSVTSTTDNFIQFIQISAAHNPFLNKIISFSSHINNFSQAQCRSSKGINPFSSHNFAAVLPGDSVAGIVVANGVLNFLNLYNTLLVVRLVLTWFPNTPPQIVSPLSTLCDPYLNIFRGIIPPLGGTLDLSPILAFLVLNAFTSAAQALPCELPPELPPTGISSEGSSSPVLSSDLTTSQEKWMRRLNANKGSNSNGAS